MTANQRKMIELLTKLIENEDDLRRAIDLLENTNADSYYIGYNDGQFAEKNNCE